jgi:manganese/zinc/iron transport system permease protein
VSETTAAILNALTLSAGYNAALVAVGAGLLGIVGGGAGAFIYLRKRALVSDAIGHATLPGVALAFLLMTAAGWDGRWLPTQMLGATMTAAMGLCCVHLMVSRTRLNEDAAIGAVLSVFYGAGIVLMTVVQSLPLGQRAGLSSYLLGSTAGMLWSEAVMISVAATVCIALLLVLARTMAWVAFDADHAASLGVSVARTDFAVLLLALLVTVIGLKVAGVVLIVAMLVIPPVTAHLWTHRADRLWPLAAAIGGVGGYFGSAISAAVAGIPTGPVIVLVMFALFALSMLLSPVRGVAALAARRWRFQRQVHERQGLLVLARGDRVIEPYTARLLVRAGLLRADGVATERGAATIAAMRLDTARWRHARACADGAALALLDDGLTPIEWVLTADQIREIDRALGPLALQSAPPLSPEIL